MCLGNEYKEIKIKFNILKKKKMIKINYDPILGVVGWEFPKVSNIKKVTKQETRIKNRKNRKK